MNGAIRPRAPDVPVGLGPDRLRAGDGQFRLVITIALRRRRLRSMRWPQSPRYLVTAGLNVMLGLFWGAWGVSRGYPWFFLTSALYVLLGAMSASKAWKEPVDRGASNRITEWGPTR
jgi:hypothetical protein